MTNISECNLYAQAALASYATGLVANGNNIAQYSTPGIMSASQAGQFDAKWKVLQQSTSTNGFSAVLLEDRVTGRKALAIAGTDSSSAADLITDLVNIAVYGTVLGMPQYISLESFYQQLVSTGKLGANEQIVVTGHSLGGFLTQAFTARHSSVVSAAYTYNAPGFGSIESMLGFLGVTDTSAGAKITNLHAADGMSLVAGLGFMLGASQGVRIEADANPANNHSVVRLGDALAIDDLYARLQPTLSTSQITSQFLAAGYGDRRLEDALDALRTVFIGSASNDANKTQTGDRDRFYFNLYSLQGDTGFTSRIGQMRLVQADAGFVSLARATTNTALAYRYALLELLPLAVVASTDAGNQTLYSAYTQRLSLVDANTGLGELTDQWLVDRAAMLEALARANINNERFAYDSRVQQTTLFVDATSGILLLQAKSPAPAPQRFVSFGGDGADSLLGGNIADRLYGGAGADTLNGQGGADYLEGNAGIDSLNGGDGADTLLGGAEADSLYGEAGQDTLRGGFGNDLLDGGSEADQLFGGDGNDSLTGGTGNDQLFGDAGADTYTFDAGWGTETIEDSGGDGAIVVTGLGTITGLGAKKVAPDAWQTPDKKVNYTLISESTGRNDLYITFSDRPDVITIRNWSPTNLGVTLDAAAPATPPTTNTYTGGSNHAGQDRLGGTGGADLMQGLDANDLLSAFGGADVIDGGLGDDLIFGGLGADNITGGAGVDFIYGSGEGNDYGFTDPAPVPTGATVISRGYGWVTYVDGSGIGLYGPTATPLAGDDTNVIDAGAGDDHIDAGTGNDIAHGGDDNDQIYGLAGNDLLYGDAGNDVIFGDGVVRTGTLESVPGNLHGNDVLVGGAGTDNLFGDGGNDEVYGGDDNDFLYGDQSTLNRNILPQQFDGNDYLDGGASNDWIEGGQRDDVIFGGTGNDTLFGDGAQNNEAATFEGRDYLDGEDGADELQGGGNDDELFGGTGNDLIWGDSAGSNSTNQGMDYLDGEAGDDQLIGGGNADELFGGDGNDRMLGDDLQANVAVGLHGKDYLDGGAGNDQLYGAGSDDELIGGDGADFLRGDDSPANLVASAHGADYLDGGAGNDTLLGDGGDDTLTGGDGDDWLAGEDQLSTSATTSLTGNDTLYGDAGNDTLIGGAGVDTLNGGTGNDYVSGGIGNDILTASAGMDLLLGGSGDDRFIFGADADGAARVSDTETDGSDTLALEGVSMSFDNIWRSGNFLGLRRDNGTSLGGVYEFFRGDIVERIEFADNVVASVADIKQLSMNGGGNNDTINGFATDDALSGGAGDDALFGSDGNDTLDGGAGNDTLDGGTGSNTYAFARGSGHDTVASSKRDLAGTDWVQLAAGIVASDVAVGRQGDAILLTIAATGDSILVKDRWTNDGDQAWSANNVRFDDGAVWSVDTLRRGLTQGTSGVDTITGFMGEDLLDGGAGDDSLNGSGGLNVFLFGKGDGHDIVHQDYRLGYQVLRFKPGVDASDVAYVQSGIDLVAVILSTGDKVRFVNAFGPSGSGYDIKPASPLNRVEFADGTFIQSTSMDTNVPVPLSGLSVLATNGDDVLDGTAEADVIFALAGNDAAYGNAGDDMVHGEDGNDYLYGGTGNDAIWGDAGIDVMNADDGNDVAYGGAGDDYIYGGNGNDTLDGGTGVDVMYGDGGDNLFMFGRGDEQDRIYGQYQQSPTTVNTLRFKPGVAVTDVSVTNDTFSGDAVLRISGTTDEVRVSGFFTSVASSTPTTIQRIVFEDGTVWDVAAIVAESLKGQMLVGTTGNDNITGTANDDTISGLAGDDILNGGAGNDTIDGGSGNDSIFGSSGSNVLIGGTGDDLIYALSVGDVVIENANQGIDTVYAGADWLLGVNTENLTLINSATTATGNDSANVITGNALSNVLSGVGGDDLIDGGIGADAMSGGAGNDICIVDNVADAVTEALNQGTDLVQSSVTFALAANVENLTLTGTAAINGTGNALDNVLTGNSASNVLTGGAGNDTIDGGVGNDTMLGGAGDDTYFVNVAADTVTESANEGIDTVQSAVTWVLGANVENLTLSGTAAINATGNALANTLTGNTGINRMDGGAGADAMFGGAGNDTYVVDNLGDTLTEGSNAGTDTVESSVAWTLGVNLESLTLTGTSAINGTGNTQVNTLRGNAADNVLDGGAGNDTMIGGAGNDTYRVDSAADLVTELGGEGTDTVESSATLTLAANVEKLTLTGTAALNATGNSLNNALTGNSGVNRLDGGTGADLMVGGAGNDTYVVDNAGDGMTELAGGGTDAVESTIGWTLGAELETLTLTGTGAINATGNALANTLIGNAGANRLDGGTGADAMTGGAGNDAYVVDNAGDTTVEAASAGTDTVEASIAWTLGTNLENLTLTGTGAISATGNTLANLLTGNAAANTLNGGTGVDTMMGGAGDDIYIVDDAADVTTEAASAGNDAVQASLTWTLAANIENLALTGGTAINGTGNTLDNVLTGNTANNTLTGGAGNDTLDGGLGNDTMVGGAGNDTFLVNVATDVLTENAAEGTDTVQSAATWTLSANLENLTLTGAGAINGTGNANANTLIGNAATNTLSGAEGNDTYSGAAGNDVFTDGSLSSSDTYLWGTGVGSDSLTDAGGTLDHIDLFAGITKAQLKFVHSANNLELSVIGQTDKLVINNWYVSAANQIEEFRLSDGSKVLASEVQGLLSAMAVFHVPEALETSGRMRAQPTWHVQEVLAASAW